MLVDWTLAFGCNLSSDAIGFFTGAKRIVELALHKEIKGKRSKPATDENMLIALVFAAEFIDPPSGIDDLLLAGIKRVAC